MPNRTKPRRKPTRASAPRNEKKTSTKEQSPLHHARDLTLPKKNVEAAGPADTSVCGEEDPGAGLEYLVRSNDEENTYPEHQRSEEEHPISPRKEYTRSD